MDIKERSRVDDADLDAKTVCCTDHNMQPPACSWRYVVERKTA
jgi:hypothetical protein